MDERRTKEGGHNFVTIHIKKFHRTTYKLTTSYLLMHGRIHTSRGAICI